MWPWKRKTKKVAPGKAEAKYEISLGRAQANECGRRSVSFSLSKGVPTILCTINGKGSRLLIDSGASLNVLEKSYAKKYGFTIWKQNGGQEISGIGGSSNMLGVSKVELIIDGQVSKMPFKAISFSGVHKKIGIAGIIGSKFLRDHKAILDYENRTMTWED